MMSRMAPRVARTSLVSAAGGIWKCIPLTVPLRRLNATLACAITGLRPVILELVLTEGTSEEAAVVIVRFEVDHERTG